MNKSFSQGEIELVNGTVRFFCSLLLYYFLPILHKIISGIDHIIFATGYRYSFPFLPQYHNSSLGRNETAPRSLQQPLVTDGTHLRSLHLDLFYIEEPTIGFMNSMCSLRHRKMLVKTDGYLPNYSEPRNAVLHLCGVSFPSFGKSMGQQGEAPID